jgi:hypothetical protein
VVEGGKVNCPNCGASNLENASICVNCGRALAGGGAAQTYTPPPPPPNSFTGGPSPQPTGAQIPNYLIQSILVTLCCCLPLGVVAIIFAAQVNSKLSLGDVAGARDASDKAKLFCWIGFGIGVAAWIIWMIMFGAGFLQAYREGFSS